jgi:DnaK suppressor protein
MAVKEDKPSKPTKKAATKKSAAKTTKTAAKTTKAAAKAKAPAKPKARKRAIAAKVPTEDDVLKMTDAQYMNASQLAFFQDRLRQMEEDILSNADETTEHLRETVIVPDPADRATIEEEHALELRTRDRERKLLKKVQQSLHRITEGEYGYCEETGEPIGVGRLIARPTATLSLEAQQRRELRQKMFGD